VKKKSSFYIFISIVSIFIFSFPHLVKSSSSDGQINMQGRLGVPYGIKAEDIIISEEEVPTLDLIAASNARAFSAVEGITPSVRVRSHNVEKKPGKYSATLETDMALGLSKEISVTVTERKENKSTSSKSPEKAPHSDLEERKVSKNRKGYLPSLGMYVGDALLYLLGLLLCSFLIYKLVRHFRKETELKNPKQKM
jgi:hypothetical protein